MPQARSIALVSDDLMFASQLQAALHRAGGRCALVVGEGVPPEDSIFIDLNTRTDERLALISSLRAERPEADIVGFCHHAARELRRAALDAGATRIVNNGALQAVALRLAGFDIPERS